MPLVLLFRYSRVNARIFFAAAVTGGVLLVYEIVPGQTSPLPHNFVLVFFFGIDVGQWFCCALLDEFVGM